MKSLVQKKQIEIENRKMNMQETPSFKANRKEYNTTCDLSNVHKYIFEN